MVKLLLPHVLVISSPAQGHVMPLMEVSHKLVDHGVKVTFVNTESIHNKLVFPKEAGGYDRNRLRLVSIPDGLFDMGDYVEASSQLEGLVKKINEDEDENEKISCVMADLATWWALEVAEKLGVKRVLFSTTSVAVMAMCLHIPKLIEEGIIDEEGTPLEEKMDGIIRLSPAMHATHIDELIWNCTDDQYMRKVIFGFSSTTNKASKLANWTLCNSIHELEPAACELVPNILTIGPLLANTNRVDQPAGHFWLEDSTSLTWLDQQPVNSVIYVAFGSITILNQEQFNELAHGLELTGRPVLWVVRPGLTNVPMNMTYPDGLREKGKIVDWAPQQKVLAHPSIACFLTHSGWNSTMESLAAGVPLLCWPYFADQFHNKTHICDIWKVGLNLDKDENGIISRNEIKSKVEELIGDEEIKTRVLETKEMTMKSVNEGGSSWKNFQTFIETLKF